MGKTSAAERAGIPNKIADLPLAIDHFRYFAGCVRAQEGSIAGIDDDIARGRHRLRRPKGIIPPPASTALISRAMEARGDEPTRWRGRLRRDVAVLIALKAVALALLWALFFSPATRVPVDGANADRQLGLTHRETPPQRASRAQEMPSVPASTP